MVQYFYVMGCENNASISSLNFLSVYLGKKYKCLDLWEAAPPQESLPTY